jgi:NAD(P)-dependent dehydrogenase (short-subunit alcohol dehydrogenase family)
MVLNLKLFKISIIMTEKFTLITGAAGFLGFYHCLSLLEMNKSIIILDIDKKKLDEVKKKLLNKFKDKNIYDFKIDITKEKQIIKLKKILKKKNIFIDSIINNAAIDAIPKKNSNEWSFVDTNQWHKELDVSLLGAYLIIKHFIKDMCLKKNGSIINIGSDLSVIAPNQKIYKQIFGNYIKPVTYSVIKHALLGMTKYFASLYGKYNVRVNMLSPGPIFIKEKKSFNKKFIKALENITPMERMGSPTDLKGAIKFLIDKNSTFLTGQNIIIDGGRTII